MSEAAYEFVDKIVLPFYKTLEKVTFLSRPENAVIKRNLAVFTFQTISVFILLQTDPI